MNNHKELYEIAIDADARHWEYVEVPVGALMAILAEIKTKAREKSAYSPEFESAWADYPPRPGNSKAAAYKAWQARIKAGASAEEMLAGTLKYAAYCKAMKTELSYIKQASTFYGPGEHFSADWTVPRMEVRRVLPDRREAPPETGAQRAARRNRWGLGGLTGDSNA